MVTGKRERTGRRITEAWKGAMPETWWVYMIECGGGKIYTGIAKDPEARYLRHLAGNGAAFTRINPPVALLGKRPCGSRSEALREERSLRRLTPGQKRAWAGMPGAIDPAAGG